MHDCSPVTHAHGHMDMDMDMDIDMDMGDSHLSAEGEEGKWARTVTVKQCAHRGGGRCECGGQTKHNRESRRTRNRIRRAPPTQRVRRAAVCLRAGGRTPPGTVTRRVACHISRAPLGAARAARRGRAAGGGGASRLDDASGEVETLESRLPSAPLWLSPQHAPGGRTEYSAT